MSASVRGSSPRTVRAELSELSELIIPLAAKQLGKTEEELGQMFVDLVNARADELYLAAVKDAGLMHPSRRRRRHRPPDPGANPRG